MNIEELFVLRLLHIFSGAFWAGTVIFMAAFIIPASAAAGPAGGTFMQKVMNRKLPMWMMIAAIVNILAGFRLMWILSDGFGSFWFSTPNGIALTIGAVAAILGMIIGMAMNRPAGNAMQKLAKEIGGGPPSAEQTARMTALRKKLTSGNNILAIMLSLALVFMSIAKYAQVIFG